VHGDGTAAGPIRVAANWPQVRLVDWDGDGDDDLWIGQPQHIPNLVFANLGQWQKGAPVFDAPKEVPVGPGEIGDLDGDGQSEWIGATRGKGRYARRVIKKTAGGYALGDELPLLEASAGKPLAPPLHNAIEPTLRVVDWDGDGRRDLLCGIRMTGYSSPLGIEPPGGWGWPPSFGPDGTWLGNDSLGAVVWHKNVGPALAPRFTVGKPLRVGAGMLPLFTFDDAACELADLDGDGQQELLVCTFDRLLWFRRVQAAGTARLGEARVLQVGGEDRLPFQRLGVLASDLDRDGLTDLVLFGPGFLNFAKNTGTKTAPRFAQLREILCMRAPVAVDGFAVPTVADLNGDHRPDLIVGTEDGFVVYFENAGGKAGTSTSKPVGVRYDGVLYKPATGPGAPASFKSGLPLAADGKVIRITTPRNLTGPLEALWGYTGPAAADWDKDGDLDLLVGCIGPFIHFYENVGTAGRARFSGRGRLKLPGGRELPNGYRVRPQTVDANGDGTPDLLAIDLKGHLMLHLRDPRAPLTELRPGTPVPDEKGAPFLAVGGTGRWNGRTILSVVDWDRDGDWDLVAGMRAKGERLRCYQNVGTSSRPRLKYIGGFPTRRPGGHYQMAEFHDFDGDGRLDVIAGSDHGLLYYFRRLPD